MKDEINEWIKWTYYMTAIIWNGDIYINFSLLFRIPYSLLNCIIKYVKLLKGWAVNDIIKYVIINAGFIGFNFCKSILYHYFIEFYTLICCLCFSYIVLTNNILLSISNICSKYGEVNDPYTHYQKWFYMIQIFLTDPVVSILYNSEEHYFMLVFWYVQ